MKVLRSMSEPLRLAPLDLFIDPLLAFQDARLRAMYAYWEEKRAGRPFPARADVSPAEIVSHLPSLFLVDVVPPGLAIGDFRVRLMGTALNDLFARDFTGVNLEGAFTVRHCLSAAPSYASLWQRVLCAGARDGS